MPAPIEIVHGERFGMLVVISEGEPKRTAKRLRRTAACKCDCGNEIVTTLAHLRTGDARSCGCVSKTHGKSGSRMHRIWKGMIQRCTNPKRAAFHLYGGRGISVCKRWEKFENFLSDMGESPAGMSIDRIDTNGNYEPGNCRWATMKEQANNKRTNIIIEFNEAKDTVSNMAEKFGLNKYTLYNRLSSGMSVSDALTKPNRYAAHIARAK